MSQPWLRPTQGGSAPAAAVEQIAALRLIGVALVAGEVVFAAIVATMGAQGMLPLASPAIPFADLGGFVVAAVLAAVAFLLRGGIWQRARAVSEPAGKLAAYRQGWLASFALLEGGILLNLVLLLLLGLSWPNIAAAAALLLVQLTSLPSESQFAEATA